MAKPTAYFEKVTPVMAERYLNASAKNRRIRPSRVVLYSTMMERGDWFVTNQGIAFDERGKLIDGQHRLHAIIRTGLTVEMLVVRGLPVGTQIVIDQGAFRGAHDQISLDRGVEVNTQHISITKQMMMGVQAQTDANRTMIRDVILVEKFFMKYQDGIRFASELFWKHSVRGVTVSPVIAPIARAYYTVENREWLREFAEILISGFTNKKNASAAIVLRNFLLLNSTRPHHTRNLYDRVQLYKRAEIALEAFLNGEPMTRFSRRVELKEELFPLPGEAKMALALAPAKKAEAEKKPRLVKKGAAAGASA